MNRLKYAPWTSLVAFVSVGIALSVGPLAAGLEFVSWASAAGDFEHPMRFGLLTGWLIGAGGVLLLNRVGRWKPVVEACKPGWRYLETLHWSVESPEDNKPDDAPQAETQTAGDTTGGNHEY